MRAILVTGVALMFTGCKGIQDYEQQPGQVPLPPTTFNGGVLNPDCSAYEWQGQTYNCDVLDRCNETDFSYRLACCDCDTALCNPDPTCPEPDPGVYPPPPPGQAESCMTCHNGSQQNDYAGTGIGNPHPWAPANYIKCTDCHAGNPEGLGKDDSHVSNPPEIGGEQQLTVDNKSYFNYLTRTGLDKYGDWTGPTGQTFTALDYIQFINPGDLRVVSEGRGCGSSGCHETEHAQWVPVSPLVDRFFTKTMMSMGASNVVAANATVGPNGDGYKNTSADYTSRRVEDPGYVYSIGDPVGRVGTLYEIPADNARYGDFAGIYQNNNYDANNLDNDLWAANEQAGKYANQVKDGSNLLKLVQEAIIGNCDDCHLNSNGANNRYADFRSSGCSSCHMKYSMDGKSRSTDPNVNKFEPADPDAIAAPERAHPRDHLLLNVAKILPNGTFVRGQDDVTCVGCHQGSNRTVLQFWGIRLDQNQDVVNNFQYPQNPVNFTTTEFDTRLFDPAVNNNTFNGRNFNQYLLIEDYDGDNLDDTPPDIHYERGMGCIDCHGSQDVHSGTDGGTQNGYIQSSMSQVVGTQCESCHGYAEAYAPTTSCVTYTGIKATCAADRFGNPMRNVTYENGQYWLTSRLDGTRHYIMQTKDTIEYDLTKINPTTQQVLYSPNASYAMGRSNGNNFVGGTGPIQTNPALVPPDFSHLDNVSCEACHTSWTNSCVGCHLDGIYDANPANYFFSNVDGERIAYTFAANFTYISPIHFNLGVSTRNEIASTQPGMKMFYRYLDLNNNLSNTFAFTDRNGNGNNPLEGGRNQFPGLQHNRILPHSTRGRIDANNEGVAGCNRCHLNVDMLNDFNANNEYTDFRNAMANEDFAQLDFAALQEFIGENPNNQQNNPYYVHMAAGLGTGLYLFDADGCPVNPLDANANRFYCPNGAPADNFDLNNVVYNLDTTVNAAGVANVSSTGPIYTGFTPYRDGAKHVELAGPLGATFTEMLANEDLGTILDSWVDADGNAQGDAANHILVQ